MIAVIQSFPVPTEVAVIKETQPHREMSIIERLGGEGTFQLSMLGLAHRIQSDSKLRKFYPSKRYTLEDITRHQSLVMTSILAASIDDYCKGFKREKKNFIYLRCYNLIQQGFGEQHYDLLVQHFVTELQESWANQATIDDSVSLLRSFRSVFNSSFSSSSDKDAESTDTEEESSCSSVGEADKAIGSLFAASYSGRNGRMSKSSFEILTNRKGPTDRRSARGFLLKKFRLK